MRFYQILIFALLMNLCLVGNLPAQSTQNNVTAVKNIYDAIQENDPSILMAELTSKLKKHDTNLASEALDRYNITLAAILENYWEQVTVLNLQIEEMDDDVIIAKGALAGRQPSDCVIITTIFQHIWSIKNGNIIEFKEESIKQKL